MTQEAVLGRSGNRSEKNLKIMVLNCLTPLDSTLRNPVPSSTMVKIFDSVPVLDPSHRSPDRVPTQVRAR